MLIEMLRAEFEHETQNTRKLLQAIPESALAYKPSEHSWTTGQLAQHIATIYHWYAGTMNQDEHDLMAERLDRPDPADLPGLLEFFERNAAEARKALEAATDESLAQNWTLKAGGRTVVGPAPRGTISRGLLFNHIYHHRGELIVYLRASGNKVPGLYGPTYEDMQAMKAGQ